MAEPNKKLLKWDQMTLEEKVESLHTQAEDTARTLHQLIRATEPLLRFSQIHGNEPPKKGDEHNDPKNRNPDVGGGRTTA